MIRIKKGHGELMPDLDEQDDSLVATGEPKVVIEPKADEPQKLQMTAEELDAIKAQAVADAQAENEERIRREEAERNGNFKLLAEQAQEELRQTNLTLWRTKALNKHKLPDSMAQALVGDTEKEIMACAKKLKEDFDVEVEARLLANGERFTPPDPQGRTNPLDSREQNLDSIVKTRIGNALGVGQVRQIRH